MSTSVKFNRKFNLAALRAAYENQDTVITVSGTGYPIQDGTIYFAVDGKGLFLGKTVHVEPEEGAPHDEQRLDYIANIVDGAIVFRGVVQTASELPAAATCNVGDMYIAQDTGIEYICVSDEDEGQHYWEKIGPEHVDNTLYMSDPSSFSSGKLVQASNSNGGTVAIGVSTGTASGTTTTAVTGISISGGNLVASKANIDFSGELLKPDSGAAANKILAMSNSTNGTKVVDVRNEIQMTEDENPDRPDGLAIGVSRSNGDIVINQLKFKTDEDDDTYADTVSRPVYVEDFLKVTQSPVSDPSASGNTTSFIDSISQNSQGVITATKKTVTSASGSAAGLMSSSDFTKLSGIASGAQVNVLEGVQLGGTDLTITNKKVNIPYASGEDDGVLSSAGYERLQKAVVNDGENTFPGSKLLVTTGTGTGVTSIDFAQSSATASGISFISGIRVHTPVNNEDEYKIEYDKVDVRNAGSSQSGLMSSSDYTKLSGIETGAQVNDLETVKVNGTALTIDANKAVNITSSHVKLPQSAVSDPSSSGNTTAYTFIDTISQNAQGVITPTKKAIPEATTTVKGLMTTTQVATLNAAALALTWEE